MKISELTDAEKVEILLSELKDAGEMTRRAYGSDRALRVVREMRGEEEGEEQ